MKEQIIRKLTSRKFLTGASLVISGLLLVFGFAENTAETVAGAVMAIVGAVGYMLAEAKVDAKNVSEIVDAAKLLVGALLPVEDDTTAKDGE